MLIVKSGLPGNPLQWIDMPQSAVARVVAGLGAQGCSFYFEPMPDGMARVAVDPEHRRAVITLISGIEDDEEKHRDMVSNAMVYARVMTKAMAKPEPRWLNTPTGKKANPLYRGPVGRGNKRG